PLVELISARPGSAANCCSSGVATDDAMVSGLAPGKVTLTVIVGKSTRGRAATGSRLKAPMPNTSTPSIRREVAIGRRMKGSEMLIVGWLRKSDATGVARRRRDHPVAPGLGAATFTRAP